MYAGKVDPSDMWQEFYNSVEEYYQDGDNDPVRFVAIYDGADAAGKRLINEVLTCLCRHDMAGLAERVEITAMHDAEEQLVAAGKRKIEAEALAAWQKALDAWGRAFAARLEAA